MKDKSQLRAMLEANGLLRITQAVVSLMMPSVRLRLRSSGSRYDPDTLPDQSPIGVSKVGGDPDLPPDFEWPLWEGIPLSFVAQFNLAEVAPFDVEKVLPSSGMLYFFYDVTMEVFISGGDPINWKVSHYNGDLSVLTRMTGPPGLPEFGGLDPCAITFQQEMTVPTLNCVEMQNLVEECALADKEKQRYWDFTGEIEKLRFFHLMGRTRQPHDHEAHHRLLGCPDVMYEDGRVEAVAGTQEEVIEPWEQLDEKTREQFFQRWIQEAVNWRLLFQIDTDDEANLNWGDAGLMFFFIHKEDLQSGNFDKVWLVYEGH